ncbi:MAG: DUF3568 family protein [Deltaproteobacteria bacterium]|nr:DUF3568 family protein [Deltaproteobacteria bacterium]MBW1925423.1 DUF3568 family protein [Deltaproteobacteria bacterium]MBW1949656.1 DUF3568 family protein [Deltaproteobacteria bacterium]MBW2009658.1 DUF3568 family protein [Deltaproteobacteria bacterium]MBW2103577.1 DUF3568 family protein [Deltaproteobacteria bacterium]
MVKAKVVAIIAGCILAAGCAAPVGFFLAGGAAGVAGYKYYQGGLTVVYRAPFMETWDAALAATRKLGMLVERSDHDLTTGKIVVKRADGSPVSISLEYKTAKETQVVIRVGHLGDKEASIAIKDKIRDELFKE